MIVHLSTIIIQPDTKNKYAANACRLKYKRFIDYFIPYM